MTIELLHWYEETAIPYVTYEPMFLPVPEYLTMQYPTPHDFIEFRYFNGMSEAKGYYILDYKNAQKRNFDIVTLSDELMCCIPDKLYIKGHFWEELTSLQTEKLLPGLSV